MIGPRLRAIIIKEIWAILRDPRSRIILVAPPLLQLFLFGFASTMEVNNIRVGVLDLDHGRWSREIVQRIDGSPNVREIVSLRSDAELARAINDQKIIVAIRFDPHFSADIASGKGATMGAIFDGRRSNAAQIISGYIRSITNEVGASLLPKGLPQGGRAVVTHWFNPNLINLWFVMPALISILAAISTLSVVSQSVARERELGTFDQLKVSPLRTYEILIGKMIPPVMIGFVNVTLFVILVPTVFGVPLQGALLPFYMALIFYLVAISGIGMLISTVSATQQQAFLGMFAVSVPMITLSGYASPVDNMPGWLQLINLANPSAWFLNISEGIFLKGMPLAQVFSNTWPIMLIAAISCILAAALFRSRME